MPQKHYNYQHFNPKDYNFKKFDGPKAGMPFYDFEATTLEGEKVKLSKYLDKPIVLETGSITCPMYANTTKAMNKLQDQYPDVHFLLLYIREAHPGAKTTATTTMEQKQSNAASSHQLYHEKRTILVDSVDGYAHKLYGSMPNMTYVIGANGIVKFRANWTDINVLKEVLKTVHDDSIVTKDFYKITKPSPYTAIRTLLIGGFSALVEFITSLPQLMRQHKEVINK